MPKVNYAATSILEVFVVLRGKIYKNCTYFMPGREGAPRPPQEFSANDPAEQEKSLAEKAGSPESLRRLERMIDIQDTIDRRQRVLRDLQDFSNSNSGEPGNEKVTARIETLKAEIAQLREDLHRLTKEANAQFFSEDTDW